MNIVNFINYYGSMTIKFISKEKKKFFFGLRSKNNKYVCARIIGLPQAIKIAEKSRTFCAI